MAISKRSPNQPMCEVQVLSSAVTLGAMLAMARALTIEKMTDALDQATRDEVEMANLVASVMGNRQGQPMRFGDMQLIMERTMEKCKRMLDERFEG